MELALTATPSLTRQSLAKLRRWASRYGRLFPWRVSSGYELAVAEILLQKTRGSAIELVWRDLLTAYPQPADLACAKQRDVRRIVGALGLGEQRSQRLIEMASGWDAFTCGNACAGLGTYGSAIVALSMGRKGAYSPVDGNVARVLTRYFGWHFDRGESRKKPEVKQIMLRVTGHRPPDVALRNVYALVDLGATVCRPRNPICAECPLANHCRWHRYEAASPAVSSSR